MLLHFYKHIAKDIVKQFEMAFHTCNHLFALEIALYLDGLSIQGAPCKDSVFVLHQLSVQRISKIHKKGSKFILY